MRAEVFHGADEPPVQVNWRRRAAFRRIIFFIVVLGQSLFGAYYMTNVLPYHGGNVLEQAIIILFTILFMWISVGFWMGLYGFFLRRCGGDRFSLCRRYDDSRLASVPLARTAIIMPIYHEPVTRTFGGLRAIYRSLERSGQLQNFEFFILSDSRDPSVWLDEQVAWAELVRELGADGRLFYRRRTLNMDYKNGNVGDFLRRWGDRFRYGVVLDADSIMDGATLVKMVRLMQCEPRIGILQTNPGIVNGVSVFARVQQFGNRIYGPLFSSGLAAMQLGEATYWGHNAIIRIEPFMRYCGLRHLKGWGLFSGPILSHDFVEAAYMGRAGYEIWLEPELQGSYEESPFTLVDELIRDKRWAKGNLQHLWIMLFEPRLRLAHRLVFLNGAMSYLASLLWFSFLVLITIETTNFVLSPPDYFPEPHSFLPLWPEWHPEWAIGLAIGTLVLLFLPKLLSILDVLLMRRTSKHGGVAALITSVLLEIVISALLAPIRMFAHTRFVLEALLNINLTWAGQNRTDETRWRDALRSQLPGSLLGFGWAMFAWWLDPLFFYWSLPVAIPLVLAAPTSVFLSRAGAGQRLRHNKLLLVPEECNGAVLLRDLNYYVASRQDRPVNESPVLRAVIDPIVNQLHCYLGTSHRGGVKAARLQELRERFYHNGPGSLSPRETGYLLRDRDSLIFLHNAIWRSEPDTLWGQLLKLRPRQPAVNLIFNVNGQPEWGREQASASS